MNYKIKPLCESREPYPEIKVERKNPYYARLLSAAYAGQESELAAVLLYSHGALASRGNCPGELEGALSCIAAVEMRHMKILGELILLLGGDARYILPNGRASINTAALPCAYAPEMIIRNSIAGEEAAIRLYRELIRSINDECVRAVLKRIILDEEEHLKLFREMRVG
jgi:bacterioferritin